MIIPFSRIATAAAFLFILPIRSLVASVPDSSLVDWSPGSSLWLFVKMALLLALVVALIWLLLNAMRRISGVRVGGTAGVEILGGIPLGPRRSIQFIRIGRSLYLIGATDHHLSMIDVIKDAEEIEEVVAKKGASEIKSMAFSKFLAKFTGTAAARKPQ